MDQGYVRQEEGNGKEKFRLVFLKTVVVLLISMFIVIAAKAGVSTAIPVQNDATIEKNVMIEVVPMLHGEIPGE